MSRFASLHSGLLARKGEALPAGPNRLAAAYYAPEDSPLAQSEPAPAEPPSPEAKAKARKHQKPRRKPSRTPGRRKTTLRLSNEQHRRLRIAAAQLDMSQQAIMVEALDAYLDKLAKGRFPGCGCLEKRTS